MNSTIDAIRGQGPITRRGGMTFTQLREGPCNFPLDTINDPPDWFCGERGLGSWKTLS